VEVSKAQRAMTAARTHALDPMRYRPAYRPYIFPPVVAGPDLVPIGDDTEATDSAGSEHGQEEQMQAGCVHDVVATRVAQKVGQNAGAEDDLRPDRPPTARI
jgi:hypothetical protein